MKTIPAIATVFVLSIAAFADEPNTTDVVAKRTATLKANAKDFQLGMKYFGESDKPYYDLLISVPRVDVKEADPVLFVAQIGEDEALRVIEHLKKTGVLDRAFEKKEAVTLRQPLYRLTVVAGDLHVAVSLGFDKKMLKSLDGLRTVLDGNAAKQMDVLLER